MLAKVPLPGRSWARLREKFSHQARHGFSKWAVVEKASGTVIGECGVHYLAGGPELELGYKLARARWRHGFASEAAQACLDWALAERPERVVAIADPGNTRSARVLGKIGMVRDGTLSCFGHAWDFYLAIRCHATAGNTGRAVSRARRPMPDFGSRMGAASLGQAARR